MTATTSVTIHCDLCPATNQYRPGNSGGVSTVSKARELARRIGWARDDAWDFCPACKQIGMQMVRTPSEE